jgi:hypothetical protein
MATISPSTNDGYVGRSNQSSWANARNNTVGTASSGTGTGHWKGISAYTAAARGGATFYNVYRSFFHFDTSDIETTVNSATLKIYGYSQTGGDLIALKAVSGISSLSNSDFNAIAASGSGWDPAGDNSSVVTLYSEEITSWTKTGYNDITLSSQAKADMESDDDLYIALINYDHDLLNVAPTGGSSANGLYYMNHATEGRRPYIDYEADAAVVTDNAIFFGTNF